MPVALRRITPAVVQSIQVFFQVVLYAGLFIFAPAPAFCFYL